jgi:hypothetical protein
MAGLGCHHHQSLESGIIEEGAGLFCRQVPSPESPAGMGQVGGETAGQYQVCACYHGDVFRSEPDCNDRNETEQRLVKETQGKEGQRGRNSSCGAGPIPTRGVQKMQLTFLTSQVANA